ncbi:MAG: class I SAM-dependent methyltransferase [Marinobacter sp.]|nr:class I SAM-dependent methyltransferase [Marinobacter sp.]
MTEGKPFSQACENNKQVILEKLAVIFDTSGTFLEIGTGTGQHAVHFARNLPHLTWQPSDHPKNHQLCLPWITEAKLDNINDPLALDVTIGNWNLPPINGVFSANTAHIMSWPEVEAMFRGAAANLSQGEAFCLYGPFNYGGTFTSASNQQFNTHLKQQKPAMGIRDMDDLKFLGAANGLELEADFEMPANNRLLVWRRR